MKTDHLSQLWDEGIVKYQSEAKAELVRDSVAADLTVDRIFSVLVDTQCQFNDFQARHQKLRDILNPITTTLQIFAQTAAHAVKLSFPPAEALFSAIVVLVKGANGVGEKYDTIADLLDDLKELLDRIKYYAQGLVDPSMQKLVVECLVHVLVVIGLATKAIKEKRSLTFLKALIGKDAEVQDALKKLNKLTVREQHAVGTTTLSMLSTTNKVLHELQQAMQTGEDNMATLKRMIEAVAYEAEKHCHTSQEDRALLEEIRNKISDFQKPILNQEQRDIRAWLNAPDPCTNQAEASKKRTPGTGVWLMNDDRYVRWKEGKEDPITWLNGGPGSGKSILTSTVIEDINFKRILDPRNSLAYFYFDFRDPDKRNCHGLLSSLIDQLAFSNPNTTQILETRYSQRHTSRGQLSTTELLQVLQQILSFLEEVYIIVDALDECDDWEELHDVLETSLGWQLDNVRLFLASRKERRIEELLSMIAVEISLQTSIVNDDIAVYVDRVLENDRRFSRWKNHERGKAEIRAALQTHAQGMFRWVFCQMEALSDCINLRDLRHALRTLPTDLYETYDRILLNVRNIHYRHVHHVLQWLACSARPVRLVEVAEVLAIDFDTDPPQFEPDYRLPDPRDVLNICSSLVTCTDKGILELAHFSVKDYLTSTKLKHSKFETLSRYHVDSVLAHEFISRTTLVYLLQFIEPITRDTLWSFPLAHYAATYWFQHCSQAASRIPNDLITALFFSEQSQFANWVRLNNIDHGGRSSIDLNEQCMPSRLYYAARAGLPLVSFRLLQAGADVNLKCGKFGSALQAACFQGHEKVVSLLLQHGAEVNICGGWHSSPLQAAASKGHQEIVALLLTHHADPNAFGAASVYRSALQAASSRGHVEIVRLLLEHGADVTLSALPSSVYGSALEAAAAAGHEEVIKLLLEYTTDQILCGGHYGSAMQAASLWGHTEVLKLLLARRANVNLGFGRNPEEYIFH